MRIRAKYGGLIQEGQPLEVEGVVDGSEITFALDEFYVEDGHHSGRFVVYSKVVWEKIPEMGWETVSVRITKDSALTIMRPDGSWCVTADLPVGYRWTMQDGNLIVQRIAAL